MTKRRVGIQEASRLLGISREAVRKRISRGSLEAEKDDQGKWVVLMRQDGGQDVTSEYVQQLKSEVEYLRQENYRKDHIIMSLSEGLKQLEAPQEQQPSWWKRLFRRC